MILQETGSHRKSIGQAAVFYISSEEMAHGVISYLSL
jgi:hypothetical protein